MPITKKIRQITRNRKNNNLAIPAAAAAIPVNPKSAATSAIIRKIKAQRSILFTSSESNRISQSPRVFFSETHVTLTRGSVITNRSFSYKWRLTIGSVVTRFKRGTKELTFARVSLPNKAEQSSGYVLLVNYEHNSLTHCHSIVDWSVTCVAI